MPYGQFVLFELGVFDPTPVDKVRTVTAKLTVPNANDPENDNIGFPQIIMKWGIADGWSPVLEADIDAFHQALVDFVDSYTGMSDVTGGVVTVNTDPVNPT